MAFGRVGTTFHPKIHHFPWQPKNSGFTHRFPKENSSGPVFVGGAREEHELPFKGDFGTFF